uniref:Myosin phosphatase Rho interacting protein n=1 Tax=Scleropages formosus TaxID=113540 RepID=A0A8C9U3Z2_SCLFO
MSSKENPCRKFQANIFNKSKCQNCFKPRESHSLSDEDLNQAKPIYGGWLLLAPEGTNFDNPLHRSRKWQRRFFILYEHGLLRYALDEMPSTLPQGTINMNQCSDVIDGEARTGQKFSLCILTPEKEHFIRAENKEIISGWLESLVVYPRTNKQNLKKKRKVEPPTPQEPGPAKVTVTSSGGGSGASVPASRASLWQEERRGQAAIPCSRSTSCLSQLGQGNTQARATRDGKDQGSLCGGRKARVESGYFSLEKAKPDPQSPQPPRQLSLPSPSGPGAPQSSSQKYVSLADVPRAKRLSHQEAFRSEKKWLERRARTRSPGREEVERLFGHERRRSQVIEKFETFEGDSVEQMETSSSSEPPSSSSASAAIPRQGRSERRHLPVKPVDSAKEQSMPDVSSSSIASYRRAKSLDRRATESSMTPDLLNFKKGWMTKLYEDGLWKKHWFVLTDQSLRYYRDSVAEEAADLDGEIDLSTCYDVTEFPVQRNYGFQIHTKEGAFTLSAMTSGIRRNWIQAIMKNVRPTIAPDVTRSLPEERAKVQASLDLGHEPPALTRSSATSELRRSRIRERRREGRSKTFDWAEFCHGQPVQKESSDRQPLKGLERDRTRRREERRRRVLNTQSSMPVTPAATVGRDARAPDDTDAGRMEVERSLSMPEVCSEGGSELGKPANVQVEIEQRWHQVETTPLREEKQVPIATIHSSDPTSSIPLCVFVQLEQAQKELTKLQEQNKQLQEQLQAARGRELSAREGYVLQCDSPTPSPHTGGWHRLHKLNQDLQTDLEAQRRKQDLTSQQVQALKRNYSEAKDVIRHHEAQIQALQTKLNNALAEILISEQAVAKMRSELKLEQERFRERKEEWEHNELTLRAQLKDSEDRLKDVEAHLLEKSQALRDLERQQALQRDHLKEVQKLQERLTEVTGRLIAAEEVHALKEERLQKNLFVLQESQEKERQGLVKNLAEAELRAQELEDRLQEAEQQVETLLLENQSSGLESSEVVHQLEEQLAIKTEAIGKLTETVRQLEEEKGRLTCRCQELLNQIAEADNEVNKLQARLKTEETNYYNLEHSYEKVSEEFQKIHKVLREKEEEIRETKEMYERLVLKKEQDLNEALIKMVALGSSLEETEMKLQAKEELICKLGQGDMGTGDAMKDLQAKLVVAEDRIAELEQHLNDLQLGYSDLQMEHCKLQDNCDVLESMSKQDKLSAAIEVPPEFADVQPKSKTYPDGVGSPSKRQRIRFSNIHCQKYMHTDGGEKMWAGSNSLDLSQDQSFSEESGPLYTQYGHVTSVSSDPEKFISIIHTLETKLFATEEKLKDITLKLEEQQTRQLEAMMEQHCELAKSETDLQEQLNESLSKVDQLTAQLRVEMDKRSAFTQETNCRLRTVNSKYEKALACVESSREKVQAILREPVEDSLEAQLRMLSEIETELVNATILNEIHLEAEKLKRSDEGYIAVEYADVLTRKLMIESEFWTEVEKLETQFKVSEGRRQSDTDSVGVSHFYEEKLQKLKGDVAEVHIKLQQRELALKEIVEASNRADSAIQEVNDELGFSQQMTDSIPPELDPFIERIKVEEVSDLSKEIVSRHLQDTVPSCCIDDLESLVHPFYRNRIDVTSGTLCMREAMIQAQIAYVACKLRADHERELKLCREACQSMDVLLQEENGVLQREITRHITELSQQQERLAQLEAHYCREMEHLKTRYEQELNQAEQGRATTELALMEKTADSQRKLEVILMDIEKMEDRHEEHVQKLEDKFHGKMQELQRIHEEEMQQLHSHYTQTIHAMEEALERLKARNPKDVSLPEEVSPATDHTWPMEQDTSEVSKAERDSMMLLRDRIQELETQMNTMKDELENKHLEGDLSSLKEKYQKDFENLKATCERGFAAMEETHQKVIEDIQRQHQREVTKLLEERERLLAEETAATIAAIEAMKNAHREEMEKTQRSQLGSMSADIDELRQQYEEELRSIHRELEVLSEQYSQKCLENAHLAQALEAERQALQQCQRENQELNAHNQELNNRLAVEITRMRSCIAGDMAESPFTQGKDLYELEVLLRVKESEIQYLKQEIHSLKDELQSALRDKKYTADKYKDIYMELSIVKAKADCDISKLKEQLMAATEALGERSTDGATAVAGYDIMKSKSNPDFLKERSSLSRQIRGVRSKVSVSWPHQCASETNN